MHTLYWHFFHSAQKFGYFSRENDGAHLNKKFIRSILAFTYVLLLDFPLSYAVQEKITSVRCVLCLYIYIQREKEREGEREREREREREFISIFNCSVTA